MLGALAGLLVAVAAGWLTVRLLPAALPPAERVAAAPPPALSKPVARGPDAVRAAPPAAARAVAAPGEPLKEARAIEPPAPRPAFERFAVPVPRLPPDPGPGVPAWRRHAALAAAPDGRPRIAIVIDDVGPNRHGSDRAVALPAAVTLAILPYAEDAAALAETARAHGHELLVHLPMEPLPGDRTYDPGPQALLLHLDSRELQRRLDWNLTRFEGFVGVNNHMGSRFTEQEGPMRDILAELHRRGLLFLDSRTSPRSVGLAMAQQLGVPGIGRDVFLDNEQTVLAIRAQLERVEAIARRAGHAVAIGHPHEETLQALQGWLVDLSRRGFVLTPVSALVAEGLRG